MVLRGGGARLQVQPDGYRVGHRHRATAEGERRRAQIARRYHDAFADLPLSLPPNAPPDDVHAWHLYVVRLDREAPCSRDQFIERLFARGIGCSVHFIPLHLHPYWRDTYQLSPEAFSHAQDSYERATSLPIYTRMSDDDVSRVIDAVRDALR
jgi:dTDP-4-amino-4,6-dideoxygalactose transaminase